MTPKPLTYDVYAQEGRLVYYNFFATITQNDLGDYKVTTLSKQSATKMTMEEALEFAQVAFEDFIKNFIRE